jgi:excisionase family DNA binding protein
MTITKSMLRVQDVADLLGLHVNTVRHWCDSGVFPVYRLGTRRDRRIRLVDVQKFLDASEVKMGG